MGSKEVVSKQPKSLWLNIDFMLLWSGQMVSNIGTQVSQLAFPLLILALTGSAAQAGFAGALRALPYLIFSLPAGALIDRWDRKRTMILCDSGRALSMASIPIAFAFGHLTILQLYLVSGIEGTLFVFFNIAEAACLPRKERVVAPRKLWIEINEGLIWLWHHPLIRFIAILTGGYNLIFAGFTLIIIVLAQQQHASSFTIGLIFSIGGIGAVLGSIAATSIQKRFSFGQVIIGTTWFSALILPFFAIAPNPFILGALSGASFFMGPVYNVVQFSYRSALIPDELQGRVNSVFRLIAFGGQPLGLALTGVLIQKIGVIQTIFICALGMVTFALAANLNRHVRNAQPLKEIENV
jgi:MFS family permease